MVRKLPFKLFFIIFLTSCFSFSQKDSYSYKDVVSLDEFYPATLLEFNPDHLNNFEIDYHVLSQYYDNLGVNYIKKGEVSFTDLYHKPVEIDISSVKFNVEARDSTISLNLALSPESLQKLFVLDEKLYVNTYGGKDFMSAKKNSYDRLLFSDEKQCFSKKYYQLWDWKSLNHPPLRELKYPLSFYDQKKTPIDYDEISSPFFSEEFHIHLDNITSSHLTFGNQLSLLENGDSYQKKLELIKKAQSSIFISVMSYYRDSSTKKMTEELIKKSNNGVKVFIIVEEVWTKLLMKKALRKMPKNGIVVIYADDLLKIDPMEKGLFHNKIWIFDGETAIIGGQNIIESENISTGYNHQSRDTDLLVRGPATTDIAKAYLDLLYHYSYKKKADKQFVEFIKTYQEGINERLKQEKAQKLRGQEYYKEKLTDKSTRLNGLCRFVIQGPQNDKHLVSKAFVSYFKEAQNSIDLTTGKIKFDLSGANSYADNGDWYQKIWNEIFKGANRGIEVNLISNGVDGGYGELGNYLKRQILKHPKNRFISNFYPGITSKLDIKAAKRSLPYLYALQNKEHINSWMFFQYMHSKTFMIDRIVVSVGSFNLDNWSSDKSHESVLICQDKELSKQYEYRYTLNKVNSTPVLVNN